MDRQDVIELENKLMDEVVRRRRLGEYNPDAKTILFLAETALAIIQHLKAVLPRKK